MLSLFRALFLSMCLLMAQHALLAHETAHLGQAAKASSEPGDSDKHQGVCSICLGHAALATAIPATPFQTSSSALAGEAPTQAPTVSTPVSGVQARSRGPPAPL